MLPLFVFVLLAATLAAGQKPEPSGEPDYEMGVLDGYTVTVGIELPPGQEEGILNLEVCDINPPNGIVLYVEPENAAKVEIYNDEYEILYAVVNKYPEYLDVPVEVYGKVYCANNFKRRNSSKRG